MKTLYVIILVVIVYSDRILAQNYDKLNKKEARLIAKMLKRQVDSIEIQNNQYKKEIQDKASINDILNSKVNSLELKNKNISKNLIDCNNQYNELKFNNEILLNENKLLKIKLKNIADSIEISKVLSSYKKLFDININVASIIRSKCSLKDRQSYYSHLFKIICINEMTKDFKIKNIDINKIIKYYDIIIGNNYFTDIIDSSSIHKFDSIIDIALLQQNLDIVYKNREILAEAATGNYCTNIPCSLNGQFLICTLNQCNCGWAGPTFIFDLDDNIENIMIVDETPNNIKIFDKKFEYLAGKEYNLKFEHKQIEYIQNNLYQFYIPLGKSSDANCCPSYFLKFKAKYSKHNFTIVEDILWKSDYNSNNWKILK